MRHEHIERLLPANYQRAATPGSPLHALLSVMELLHAPSEATLRAVDDLVAPYRAPDRLVPFLVRWVAWEHLLGDGSTTTGVPVGRLRDLVAGAAALAARRGTAGGLADLLTLLCGVPGFVVEEPAASPFHIVVHVPAAAGAHLDLVRRAVAAEKPASTTSEIVLEPDNPET
jgi:phage tail-like protein